jgi:hypothetical protein
LTGETAHTPKHKTRTPTKAKNISLLAIS